MNHTLLLGYRDGSFRDVTPCATFESTDEAVLTATADPVVTAGCKRRAAVNVLFDSGRETSGRTFCALVVLWIVAVSSVQSADWTVQHKPGFWPFDMSAKPAGQSEEQFLRTLSYFDAANFALRIRCPVFAEVSLLDTVTASGNQIAALTGVRPGLLELVCDPWHSHASSIRGSRLRAEAINRWLNGDVPLRDPIKSLPEK